MDQFRKSVCDSIRAVQGFVETVDYKGYEPFDGLSSVLRPLTCGNLFLQRVLQQLVRQSPVNLRPLLGITSKDSTKGRGYMAHGYLLLYRSTGNMACLERAEACLDWLDVNRAANSHNHAWCNHFDFAGRGGMYTQQEPIIVWTSLIGRAYIEAWEITHNDRWLQIADSVCQWLMELPRERTATGSCLSYLQDRQLSIHNANLLGAAMLARTSAITGNREYCEVSRSAVEYSCRRQLGDGSWWYAEDPKYRWIDNFHTGYNLDSLKIYAESSGDDSWDEHIRKGLSFYKLHFFEDSGRPRYYYNRTYPVDSQCAGQSIDTLAFFGWEDPDSASLAKKVACWTIENMQEPDGHFHYRHYPWAKDRTSMLHWSQAVIFKGLAQLLWMLSTPDHPVAG